MKATQNHKTQANSHCRICHAYIYLREKNRAKRGKEESCKVSELQFHHIIERIGLKYDELIFMKNWDQRSLHNGKIWIRETKNFLELYSFLSYTSGLLLQQLSVNP